MMYRFLILFFLVSNLGYGQIGFSILNEQMVKNDVLEVYNKDFYSSSSIRTAKVWVSDGIQNSEFKYVSRDKYSNFKFSLNQNNFHKTKIYYTYDLECVRLDMDKISKSVTINALLSYGLNTSCKNEIERGNLFPITCVKPIIDSLKVIHYNPDAIFILEQLEALKINPQDLSDEDKMAINEVYDYGISLYMANQPAQILRLREIINLYFKHQVLSKEIATQVREQKTMKYGLEVAYIQSNYDLEDYKDDLLYPNWLKKPSFSIRAYRFYDFKKNDTRLWPTYYTAIGFSSGSIAYSKVDNVIVPINRGVSYDNFDIKFGWTPFPWPDKKVVLGLCFDAGLEARFRNEYSIERENDDLSSFKKERSFEFESVNIAASVGLVLGFKPVIFRLVYNYAGNQNWLAKKDENIVSLKTNRSASFSVIIPIKNKKTYRYNRGQFSL